MVIVKKIRRRVNPPGQTKNPVAALLGHVNPKAKKGVSSMAKKQPQKQPQKKRRRAAKPTVITKYRTRAAPKKAKGRKRNPKRRGILTRPLDVIRLGALALAGLVITRQIPQAVLGTRNVGIVGYFSNVIAASLATAVMGRFVDREAAKAVGVGGALYVVERILNEQLTPLGKALSLSGIGDARAAGSLRGIESKYFPWPVVTDRKTGQPVIPREITEAAVNAVRPLIPMPAPALAGGRFARRF